MSSSSFVAALGASFLGPGLPVGTIPASGMDGPGLRITLSGGLDLDGATLSGSDVGASSLEDFDTEARGRMGLVAEVGLAQSFELVTGFGTPSYLRFSALDESRGHPPLSLAVALGVSWSGGGPHLAGGVQSSRELALNHDLLLRPMAALWWQPNGSTMRADIPETAFSQGLITLRRDRPYALVAPIGVDFAMQPDDGPEVALNLAASWTLPLKEAWEVECYGCDIILTEIRSKRAPVLSVGLRFGPFQGRRDKQAHRQPPASSTKGASTL